MAATKADLATKVLQRLQVIDAEEVAANADHQFVEDAYDDVHELMSAEGIITWNLADSIPSGAVQSMTAIMAYECCQEFGVQGAELNAYAVRAEVAKREIRRLGKGMVEPAPVVGEYY